MSKDINIRIDNGFQHSDVLNALRHAGLSPLSRESCRYVPGDGFSVRGKVFDRIPNDFMRLSISTKGFFNHYFPQMLDQGKEFLFHNTAAEKLESLAAKMRLAAKDETFVVYYPD